MKTVEVNIGLGNNPIQIEQIVNAFRIVFGRDVKWRLSNEGVWTGEAENSTRNDLNFESLIGNDMNDINSNRRYSVTGYEPSSKECYTPFSDIVSLDTILTEDVEVYLSILDDVDALLDLRIGDKLITRADRSDEFSSVTVTRIA